MTGTRGYEAVREALQERGYLATPLERLFFGGIGDPLGRSRRGRLYSSLLAGLVGGPLLGVLLAAVVVIEGRGAVPTWPDGVLYALLFAPIVALALAVIEAVVTTAIRVLGRMRQDFSPRAAALCAGTAVAVAFAVYLGVWWLRSGGRFNAGDLAALAVLALGAGFAGRVVSAAALVHATLATGRVPARRAPRAMTLFAALAVAAAALAALLPLVTAARQAASPAAARIEGAPPPGRALFVAWDGLDRDLARGLLRIDPAGQRFAFLRAAMERHASVDVGPGWDPVAGWTTVATGSPPSVHGVTGLELTGLRGAASPVPRAGVASGPLELLERLWPTERRVVRAGVRQIPAFWEITATRAKTAAIGWWGTWPAAAPGPAGGYVVSDGALAALRGGHGVEETIHPPAWGTSRGASWLARADAAPALDTMDEAVRRIAHEARAIDLFALAALDEALADPQVGVATVYLPGVDILRERFRRIGRDPFETLDAISRHVADVDRVLADILSRRVPVGPAAGWVVGLPGRAGEGLSGFVAGPASPAAEEPVPLVALAPTWLTAAGYPVDDRMTGPALGADGNPAARVDRRRTSAVPAAPAAASERLEGDVLERLRSLGYVR